MKLVAVITPAVPNWIFAPTFKNPFTSTSLLNVAAVPVIILSVDATPISKDPSPENLDARLF